MPTLSLIVAMTESGIIGNANQLPWHLPEDLKHFKAITMGHPIVMGRKTFTSIGRALPGRRNLVISRQLNLKLDGAEIYPSLEQALASCTAETEVFIIGGAEIFALALPKIKRLYLTIIHQNFPGDTKLAPFDLQSAFKITDQSPRHLSQNGIPYSFIVAERQ